MRKAGTRISNISIKYRSHLVMIPSRLLGLLQDVVATYWHIFSVQQEQHQRQYDNLYNVRSCTYRMTSCITLYDMLQRVEMTMLSTTSSRSSFANTSWCDKVHCSDMIQRVKKTMLSKTKSSSTMIAGTW